MNVKKRWFVLVSLALIAFPVIIELFYIQRYAINVPFWDEWLFVPLLKAFRSNTDWLPRLWAPLNEHRMVFPRLVSLGLSQISGWNVIVEMYFSWFLACLQLLGLGLIYRRARCGPLWAFFPISWLVFSLGQYENILYGMQMAFYLNVLGIVWSIYFLSFRSWRSVSGAAVCGLVAMFSLGSGLLIWPVGLLYLVAVRSDKRQIAFWGLVGLLAVVAYYIGYRAPSQHPPITSALRQPLTVFVFFLANVGTPLAGNYANWAVFAGACLVVWFLVLVYKEWIAGKAAKLPETNVILVSLILVSVLASLAVTVGRVGMGSIAWAMASRYTAITSLGIAGSYMLSIKHTFGLNQRVGSRRLRFFLLESLFLFIMFIGLIMANLTGIRAGRIIYDSRLRLKYILQTFEIQSDNALKLLYAFPGSVRGRAPYLKQERLSVFREPMEVVLPPSYEDGQPFGEIRPNRGIIQSFKCPVSVLRDFEIVFATYDRSNNCSIEVTLTNDDRVIMQKSLHSNDLKNNDWARFVLSDPIENCTGRPFVLRIESPDANIGNAVTVWTYPRYYEGDLISSQGVWVDRVIGLELNTYSATHLGR